MCFMAVLGIALTTYIALSANAMRMSDRSYFTQVSSHLAEMGLERSLRSFGFNDFGGWTISGTTAKQTISVTTSHYASSGITAAINLRVDHYNATVWNSTTAYTTSSMVWYRGVWFQCISGHTNQVPPNTTYWKSAASPWKANVNYNATGTDIVISGGSAYRCTASNSNQAPPNSSYWSSAYSIAPWDSATSYAIDDVVLSGGTRYRCIAAHSNQAPPNATYWIGPPVIYSEGTVDLADRGTAAIKTQLRAAVAPMAMFPNLLGATGSTGTITFASTHTGTISSYNSPLDSSHSTAGASAIIAASGNVNVGNTNIAGYVASGGTVTQNSAKVGNVSPATSWDSSRVSTSAFVPQFTESVPTGGTQIWPTPANGSGGTSWSQTIGNSSAGAATTTYWISGDFYLGASQTLNVIGPVKLRVTGQIYIYNGSAGGQIIISGNGSLELHCATGSPGFYIAGQGIDNQTKDPKKCVIYYSGSGGSGFYDSTSGYNLTLNYSNSYEFYGVIYAPNCDLVMGPIPTNFNGAIAARSIRFLLPNTSLNLRYDTSLRTAALPGTDASSYPFTITEWRELTSPSERVALP